MDYIEDSKKEWQNGRQITELSSNGEFRECITMGCMQRIAKSLEELSRINMFNEKVKLGDMSLLDAALYLS